MTDAKYSPRRLVDDAAVVRVGEGLLDRSLPRAEWTHEAHLAACLWLVDLRSDIDVEASLPAIIAAYNVAVGGVNDDTQGYHETLTQLYLAGVRAHAAETRASTLVDRVNGLLSSRRGARDWPLFFYSPEVLFSAAARRYFVTPDRCAFDMAPADARCAPRIATVATVGG